MDTHENVVDTHQGVVETQQDVVDTHQDVVDTHQDVSGGENKEDSDKGENTNTHDQEKTKASSMEILNNTDNFDKAQTGSVYATPPFSRTGPGKSHCSVVLKVGDKIVLPRGSFHSVTTTSPQPSSYMYLFTNTTLLEVYRRALREGTHESIGATRTQTQIFVHRESLDGQNLQAQRFKEQQNRERKDGDEPEGKDKVPSEGRETEREDSKKRITHQVNMYQDSFGDIPTWQDFTNFVLWKWATFKRSGSLLVSACRSVISGTPMTFK
ncbi:Vitamin K-dependent gamma-carboxylase-like 1 [Homarus americanus]|uniref:Vitamin K-dependent gamma-carboxylase-like 1 n=2 Tax=Homarus americanus TaxID=6706 RepID=A0A8J5T8V6_HOMAM|nr:Vitamin K-dependent gamma-carboxylase-like 1 [Homarus americanus]